MTDGLASPFVGAAKRNSFLQCFADLKELITYPHLSDEEKILWIWLAAHCADDMSFSCAFSYEQISLAMNKPPRLIHQILFRLLIMGFLIADIAVHYSEPTPEMVQKVRRLKLKFRNQTPLYKE